MTQTFSNKQKKSVEAYTTSKNLTKSFHVLFIAKNIAKLFNLTCNEATNHNQEEGKDIVRMPDLNDSMELQVDER